MDRDLGCFEGLPGGSRTPTGQCIMILGAPRAAKSSLWSPRTLHGALKQPPWNEIQASKDPIKLPSKQANQEGSKQASKQASTQANKRANTQATTSSASMKSENTPLTKPSHQAKPINQTSQPTPSSTSRSAGCPEGLAISM